VGEQDVFFLEHMGEEFLRQRSEQVANRGQLRVLLAVTAHNFFEHDYQARALATNIVVVTADNVTD
jgi:hypothetical protein